MEMRGPRSRRGLFLVCRAGLTARRCKSSSQRDGREVIAKRKGEITLAASRGLKEARSKRCEPMNKNRIRGLRWRVSERMIAKPISIKPTGGKIRHTQAGSLETI